MTAFVIRHPRPGEAEALAELHLRTWEETCAGRFPASAWGPDARTARLTMWSALCDSPPPGVRLAVAETGDGLIGFAGTGPNQDEQPLRARQVWFMYVVASAHGSGFGQSLLDEVLGGDAATLWVLDGNHRAIAFYTRNGFRPDGTRQPSGYEDGGDEIRMVR